MISRINFAIKISLFQLLLLTAVASVIGQQHDQVYNLEDNPQDQLFANSQQQFHHDSIPGHYKFELAPKMEPPTVRKPPYQQSGQICPGLEPFAGFSPKDTLCGDLNQGKLPLNPIGQSFSDQSYPFELIKNKTLQFLARALPVLKLEYETIPKVARYLPTNQLLNPTHQASPLTSDQFNQLNHRFASANGFIPDTFLQDAPYLKKRRRKRSIKSNKSSSLSNIGMPTVAEMSPNATLTVVSSAHSAGRIGHTHGSFRASANSNDSNAQPMSSGNGESTLSLTGVITKDGYKSIGPSNSLSYTASQQGATAGNRQQQLQPQPQPQPQPVATQRAANYYSWAPSIALAQSSNSGSYGNKQHSSEAAPLSSSWINAAAVAAGATADNTGSTTAPANNKSQKLVQTLHTGNGGARSGAGSSNTGDNGQKQERQQYTNGQPSSSSSSSSSSSQQVSTVGAINSQSSPPTQNSASTAINQNHATSGADKESRSEQHNSDNAFDNFVGQGRSNGNAISMATSTSTSSPSASSSPSSNSEKNFKTTVSKKHDASKGYRLGCNDSGNGFTTVICQLASALIEGDRQPTWFQVAKGLSNMVSSASSSDNTITTPSNIWSVLSSLTQEPSAAKSNNGVTGSNNNMNNGALTRSNIMNVLGPIASFISGTTAKDSSSTSNNNFADGSQHKEYPHQTLSASSLSSSLATTLPKLALAGWASSALANLVEYFVPSIFQSTSRTFAKRKKPFDPLETFVDTPASLSAALNAGKQTATGQQQSANLVSTSFGAGKQPPTPCPSVEEYISPTFARNYQGAWKYVVQIPHEGYFTQTIQKTSCVNKKCEFTDGVCHESPRWVSLLVAEIYYPNTIFSPQAGVDQANGNQINHMVTSSSTSNIQQLTNSDHQNQQHNLQSKAVHDPLQMTDSLSSYNHNLNNAFISAANELGWDPNNVNNMQHLANAYNYQLMQRNGLTPSNTQPVVEARSSQTSNMATQASSPTASISSGYGQTLVNQPMTQQQKQQHQQQQLYLQQQQPQQYYNTAALSNQQMAQLYNNDYIATLAAAALQQNPNLNINDLINSLQLAQKRKKRDVSPGIHRSTRNQFNNPLESLPSLNDINSPHVVQQTSTSNQYKQMQPISPQQQKGSVAEPSIGSHASTLAQSNQIDANTNQLPSTNGSVDNNGGNSGISNNNNNNGGNQVECDGHDKIGCYVVRVYYDWFLVNGSCKCWKTTSGSQQSGTQTSSGNSFLRRIFTG